MLTRVHVAILLSIFALVLTPVLVHSHGGGLDAYGCQNDRKHGGYHCHQGQFAGKAFASKQDMLEALERPPTPTPKQQEATTVLTPQPSEPGHGRACVREDKTKEIMCGELVR